jgi:ATP-binding cassette subfamily F protein 3
MATILSMEGLSKAHGPLVLFENATLAFDENDKIGLIGRNGAGKSTLLNIITGHEEADAGFVSRHPNLRLGYLKQLDDFEEGETVLDFLLRQSGKPDWFCGKIASQFELKKEKLTVAIASLSGGWQMRVKLSALLCQEPNFLLLDEPTNFLDLNTQLLLEAFLRDWHGGFLIVSHDREFLSNTCTHTLELEHGSFTFFPGDIETYLAYKEEQLAFKIKYNQKIETEKKKLLSFVERFGAKASKATQAQSKLKQMRKLKTIEIKHRLKTVRIVIPKVDPRKTFAVKASRLSIGYGDRTIATDINFEIDRGQKVALLGQNGAGKSTLLKTLAGLIEKKDGTFAWNNRTTFAYYDQHTAEQLHPADTIGNYLTRKMAIDLEPEVLLRMAGNFLFTKDDLDKTVSLLSGGERSRLALAGILLQKPDVLLLDEPTNHLDLETVEALGAALKAWNGTVIFVSHSRTFVNLIATRILEVRDGSVRVFPGSYEEYVYQLQQEEGLATSSPLPSPQDEARENVLTKAERHEKIKELKRSIIKVEKELDKLEAERSGLMKLFTQDPMTFDLERTRSLTRLETMIPHAEAEWNRLTEELANLEKN